jgi:pyroglutamyl-peptidase
VTPGPPRHILLTGFEPFDGDTVNPSGEVAKQLDGRMIGDCVVRSVILSVQHEAARAAVAPLLDAPGLVAVVHLAGGRPRASRSSAWRSTSWTTRPDAHGQVLCDVPCVEGGPAGYFSTLPLREVLAALTAEGIPASISSTAGTYLCNDTLYTTLHALARRGLSIPAGFIHLPLIPSMVTAHHVEEPSMDLSMMIRAVEIALPRIALPTRGAHAGPR